LNALANKLSIRQVVAQPGDPPPAVGEFKVELVKPSGRELSVAGDHVSELTSQDATFDLDRVAKDVRFDRRGLDNLTIVGGMPIADPVALPVGTTLQSVLAPADRGPLVDS
jgi:hypothetical protein